MMRGAVIAVVTALLLLTLIGWPQTLGPVLMLAVLLAGLVFENFRYRRLQASRPGPGFAATAKQFVDPETGAAVQVWFNATTGERRYVAPTIGD